MLGGMGNNQDRKLHSIYGCHTLTFYTCFAISITPMIIEFTEQEVQQLREWLPYILDGSYARLVCELLAKKIENK